MFCGILCCSEDEDIPDKQYLNNLVWSPEALHKESNRSTEPKSTAGEPKREEIFR